MSISTFNIEESKSYPIQKGPPMGSPLSCIKNLSPIWKTRHFNKD